MCLDSGAVTSLADWHGFRVMLPEDGKVSFLFLFPKNFLKDLNFDFFFPK